MSMNRDEALRARDLAEGLMKKTNFTAARRLAMKAQKMDSTLENMSRMVMVCDVHCAATEKLFGEDEKDWYGILQVEQSADDAVIKRQYKRLALLLHPDKNKFPGADSAFILVGEAQMTLLDKEKRKHHDTIRSYWREPVLAPSYERQQKPNYPASVPSTKASVPMPGSTAEHNDKKMKRKFMFESSDSSDSDTSSESEDVLAARKWAYSKAGRKSKDVPMPGSTSEHNDRKMKTKFMFESSSDSETSSESKDVNNATKEARKWEYTKAGLKSKDVANNATKAAQKSEDVANNATEAARKSEDVANNATKAAQKSEDVANNATKAARKSEDVANNATKAARKSKDVANNATKAARKSEDVANNATKAARKSEDGGQQPRRSVRSKREVSYNENLNEGDEDLVDEMKTHEDHHSSASDSEEDLGSGSEPEPKMIQYDDPEFNEFETLREKSCFQVGQIWALYDEEGEGLPRIYALIKSVTTTPNFTLKYVWLEPEEEEENGTRNLIGKYETGRECKTDQTSIFSHMVCNRTRKGGRHFKILPKKGETWALFKKIALSDSYEYEYVEVLSAEGTSLKVNFLTKVEGLTSVFCPMPSGGSQNYEIPPNEFCRFSHCIPSVRLKGTEGRGVMEGWHELDPAALPVSFLKKPAGEEASQDQDHDQDRD